MEIFDFLIIKTLHDLKNITNTSKTLYLSQPGLTERIKKIEKELNTKLITSSNKGTTFTHSGDYVATYATELLTSYTLFCEELANMNQAVSGTLRIGAPSIIARFYIPLLIRKFNQLYPKVTFEIYIANSSDVLVAMKNNSLHFGFLREDFGWENGVKKLLTVNHLCAVSKTKFELKNLPDMPRIDYQTDTYFRAFLDNWWDKTFDEKPNIIMQVSNLDLCKEMVFSGVGYSFLPSIVLSDHPKVFQIPLCDEKGVKIQRMTWLVCKDSVFQRKLPKTFYDFMETNKFESFLRNY